MNLLKKTVYNLYERTLLKHPLLSLALILVIFAAITSYVRFFEVDASSDSLVMQQDRDLQYFRKIKNRYHDKGFIVVTYTPQEDLLSDASLERLGNLRDQLRSIENVSSVLSLLDVPLLRNPPGPLKDLKSRIKTLESPDVNIEQARKEFRTSPLYHNILVSPDLKSTAIQINLKKDEDYKSVKLRRSKLQQKKFTESLTKNEKKKFKEVSARYQKLKDKQRKITHAVIEEIRNVVDRYRDQAELFLGGVPVITDNIISYIRSDLKIFGAGILLMIILMLGVMFRSLRWVVFPVLCCVFSGLVMMGLLGLLGWNVTVVSSNFISLQLIFTLSLVIHVMVRYCEVLGNSDEETGNTDIVSEASTNAFSPCLFASLSTIAGFSSLLGSSLLPVVNFGWIMTLGVLMSLIVTFLFLPVGLASIPKPDFCPNPYQVSWFTSVLSSLTENKRYWIIGAGLLTAAFALFGINRLKVENSFVNYFRESTEVYQGLKFIDQNLGGTTPLSVIVNFDSNEQNQDRSGENQEQSDSSPASSNSAFSEFQDYSEPSGKNNDTYWYTTGKMRKIDRIHDYIKSHEATGKVRSLATMWKIGKYINQGEPLDNLELQVLFNGLPESFENSMVDGFSSVEHNQARIMTRVQDTTPGLNRNKLLTTIQNELPEKDLVKEDRFRLTGLMVLYNNMLQNLYSSQVETLALTVLLLLGMFLLLFRSLKLALIALIPDLIATVAILGIMGVFGIPLDMMTITIVAITVGIAVDDTIHYLHRFEEKFDEMGNYIETMHYCHSTIGNAMTYTTLAIAMGFSVLVMSKFIPTVYFGLLAALAMISALLASLLLLPALVITIKPFGAEQP